MLIKYRQIFINESSNQNSIYDSSNTIKSHKYYRDKMTKISSLNYKLYPYQGKRNKKKKKKKKSILTGRKNRVTFDKGQR